MFVCVCVVCVFQTDCDYLIIGLLRFVTVDLSDGAHVRFNFGREPTGEMHFHNVKGV